MKVNAQKQNIFNGYFWEWDLGSDERIYPDPVCLQFVHVLLALKRKLWSDKRILRFSRYNLSRILKWNVSSKLIGIEEVKKLRSQGIDWITFESHPTWLSKNMVETKYWKNVGLDCYIWQLRWVCKEFPGSAVVGTILSLLCVQSLVRELRFQKLLLNQKKKFMVNTIFTLRWNS